MDRIEESLNSENFAIDLVAQLQKSKEDLREINLLIEQSQVEVDKLTQRNASINAHLQQVQTQIESVPPSDIRVAYDAAIEAQQRLAVMRGQLEKLQSDEQHVQHHITLLEASHSQTQNGSGAGAETNETSNAIEIMTQAQESERQRLSRQMHDGPAQALSNFILQTEIAMRLFDVDPEQAKDELNNLKKAASKTFQKVRDFIFDLRPMMLDDLGLIPTLKRYSESFSEKTGQKVQMNLSGSEKRFEAYIEVLLFRAVQELLGAESLHQSATEIKVLVDIAENEVRVNLENDGRGFDMNSIPDDATLGINAIRERIEMLGGKFDIDAAIGQGARFTLSVPIDETELIG
jgi:two-component system sensor histidine kinase DegS